MFAIDEDGILVGSYIGYGDPSNTGAWETRACSKLAASASLSGTTPNQRHGRRSGSEDGRRFDCMKRSPLLLVLALVLVVLALGGWAVDGVRWALSGPRRARGRLATT